MKVLGLVFLIAVAYAKHEYYRGWKSFFIKPSNQEQLNSIGAMLEAYELDIFSQPIIDREGLVLVKPEHIDGFLSTLEANGMEHRLHSDDLKAAFDMDDLAIEARHNDTRARGAKEMPYDNYQELEVIYDYIDDIADQYPDVVTLVEPATSFEGRPIKYLKISTTNFEDSRKPIIVVDGTAHAREWISPPTVTWIIRKLVEDVTEPDLLDNFDWIILPVVNPDGYKFTFTNTRMWRKTRSTDQHSLSQSCPGVDPNRNYDFFFGTVGSSSLPCADTYPGSRAFSEIETRVVRDILQENLSRVAMYLTMHSYGSMILYPWGHNGSLSSHAFALHAVGIAMADEINRNKISYFPNYVVGNSVLTIGYGASGASEDYAHSIGVTLSYTYELPGLQAGFNGFHLQPRYIEQVARETWEGIVAGVRTARQM